MATIREITAIETFLVRHPVLRKGKPIESCQFEGDDLNTTKHFGLYEDSNLVGVISIFECKSVLFNEKKQFQIRGMAVLENFQKKGFGEALMHHAELALQKEKANLIWFNARKTALGFYEKLGYRIIGDPFEIENVGIHYLMYKKWNSID